MNNISHDEAKHQFSTLVDGHRGLLDYTLANSSMTITHTEVPPAISGRGVAAGLVRAALAHARARQLSVNPLCSYAVAYLQRHRQEADQQHREDLLDEALDESFPASDSPSIGGIT